MTEDTWYPLPVFPSLSDGMAMQDFLENLNPRQREAVTLPPENALVLAGAGSGKTRVLTARIAWLLTRRFARPSEILAVTFKKEAASEMRERLDAMELGSLSRMWAGTFHSICLRMLREHTAEAGLRENFTVLGAEKQKELLKRLLAGMLPKGEDADEAAGLAVKFINGMKKRGVRAGDVPELEAGETVESEAHKLQRTVYLAYEKRCAGEGLVDFEEMLLSAHNLLKDHEAVRRGYQARFRFVLVDEFQDTDVLQYRWVKLLCGAGEGEAGASRSVAFVVGDDDQSIYAFRGARVGNMKDFMRDFGVKSPLRLEQNYRSTGVILDAANAVISRNKKRMEKKLWTASGRGEPILVKTLEDNGAEAAWVAGDIAERHRTSGLPWSDFAVLYRVNAQSRSLEDVLKLAGIPYQVHGAKPFFERDEVRNVVAWLRMLMLPDDDASLLRALSMPPRGVDEALVERLKKAARADGRSLWGALAGEDFLGSSELRAFAGLIGQIRREALEAGTDLPELVLEVVRRSGLDAFCRKKEKGRDLVDNMREVASAAQAFLKEQGVSLHVPALKPARVLGAAPLQAFLDDSERKTSGKKEPETKDAVQLMTIHAAKGLEFHQVNLVGAEQNLLPYYVSLLDGRSPEDFSLEEERFLQKSPDEARRRFREELRRKKKLFAEERRLMYVAITRAKRFLRITHCATRNLSGRTGENPVSQFVEEIPPELIRHEADERRDSPEAPWEGIPDPPWEEPVFEESVPEYWEDPSDPMWERTVPALPERSEVKSTERRGAQKPGKAVSAGPGAAAAPWRPGQRVRHATFGTGTVRSVQGSGEALEIRVHFDGLKKRPNRTIRPSLIPGKIERIED